MRVACSGKPPDYPPSHAPWRCMALAITACCAWAGAMAKATARKTSTGARIHAWIPGALRRGSGRRTAASRPGKAKGYLDSSRPPMAAFAATTTPTASAWVNRSVAAAS